MSEPVADPTLADTVPKPVIGGRLAAPVVDLLELRNYRQNRLRESMKARGICVAVLSNPMSTRYAADLMEYALYMSRTPTAILLFPVEGPVVGSGTYLPDTDRIDRKIPSFLLSTFDGGLDLSDRSRLFADYMKSFLKELGFLDTRPRVGLERMDPSTVQALMQAGIDCVDITGAVEEAKSVKSSEEVTLIRHAVAVAQFGIAAMRRQMRPGVTENELFSVLNQVNIAHGGYWCDGRMLASGHRINPWLQEATDKVIEAGDLVGFDTDMVGPNAYFADISRTWLCGDGKPTARQKELYQRAYDEVYSNMELIRPGATFRDISLNAFRHPEAFLDQRYPCLAHGVGMCDEYPKIAYPYDWDAIGYDGVVEAGMVLCVESYVGKVGETDGVKLEQQVLVTETGCEILSTYPLEEIFLK